MLLRRIECRQRKMLHTWKVNTVVNKIKGSVEDNRMLVRKRDKNRDVERILAWCDFCGDLGTSWCVIIGVGLLARGIRNTLH